MSQINSLEDFRNYLDKPRQCMVCRKDNPKKTWAEDGIFKAVQCCQCGLVWIAPFLTEA